MMKMRLLILSYCLAFSWAGQLFAQADRAEGDQKPAGLGSALTLEELRNGGKSKESAATDALEKGPRLITSAAEPSTPLRYRFWPAENELKAGDAKVHFFRTAVSFKSIQDNKVMQENFRVWEEMRETGKSLPVSEIRNMLRPYRLQLDELDQMALCDHQNLDLRLRELRGSDVYAVLLEEVQLARTMAKMLRWRMIEQAADGDWDGFTRTGRTGYRLARLVGTGETLIHSLVGVAISQIISQEVQQAAQLKGCPNFYWALACLPRPMFDIRSAMELETSISERVFPFLVECRQGPLTEQVVQEKWEKMVASLRDIDSNFSPAARLVGALSVEKARANLLQRGWTEEKLKLYPVMQLVLIDMDDTLRARGEMLMRYFLLPDHVGQPLRVQANTEFEHWMREEKSLASVVASLLFPAVMQVSSAARRPDYVLAGMMTREALRMHVEKHGTLPATLADLDSVPAISNPYTNQPFDYSAEPKDGKGLVEVLLIGEIPATNDNLSKQLLPPFLIQVRTEK
jgi:hypothetical protein